MNKPIRVALSGSGFRLPAHIGALEAILEAGYDIVEICGTSGGSIVAAMFASGMSIDTMKRLALTQDWSKMLSFEFWAGVRNGGYCSGNALLNFLSKHTAGITFGTTKVPLKIVASDLLTEKEVVFSKAITPTMPIALAARASASIPFVFVPVHYMNWLLVDGGCCDNMPADQLLIDGTVRLGVYLVSKDPAVPIEKIGLITMAEQVIDLLMASSEDAHSEDARITGATIVHVDTSYAGSLDTHMPLAVRQRLIQDGHDQIAQALKLL